MGAIVFRRLAWALACLWSPLLAGAASQAGETPTTAPARPLAGQVLNHIGGGVRDAEVTVELASAAGEDRLVVLKTRTDELGDFSVELPAEFTGEAVVRITKALYAPATSRLEIGGDGPSPFVVVELEGDTVLEGVVQDREKGSGVPEAEVLVTDGFRSWEGQSDPNGRFRIAGLPPGGLRITVTATGFARHQQAIRPEQRGTVLTIDLGPEWLARVRLTDQQGRAVAQAIVEALPADNSDLLSEVSDADGRVLFAGLPPSVDLIRLRVQHSDFARMLDFEHLVPRPVEGGVAQAEIQLRRAAVVRGQVVDADSGKPVAMARVVAGERIESGQPMAWTDPEGLFELTGVPPGSTVVTVHDPEHAPGIERIDTLPGQAAALNFKLASGTSLRGQVLDEQDGAVAEATILIEAWRDFRTAGLKTLTDDQGRFEIDHAPRSELTLAVFAPGYEPLASVAVQDAGQPVRLVLRRPTSPQAPPSPGLGVGRPVPDLKLTPLEGSELDLSKLRGKVVFLDFWATWCPPCVAEISHVKNLHQAMSGRADFVLIGISLDHDKETLSRFINEQNLTWPQVFSDGGAGRAAEAFGVRAIPSTFLIDGDGRVVATDLRGETLVEQVSRYLKDADPDSADGD